MFKQLIILIILFTFVNSLSAQLDAEVSFNAMSFCGVNSIVQMQDVSTGGIVATRTWSVVGPAAFAPFSGNGPIANVTLTELGIYTVILTVCDAASNCNTQIYNNLINVLAKPDATINITSLCVNKDNIFRADILPASLAMDSFKWYFGETGAFVNGTTKQQTYSFNSSGGKTVQVIVKATNGCRDTATRNIMVLDVPKAIITASDTFVCVGTSVNFSGLNSTASTPTMTYSWDTDYNTGIDNNNTSFTILANASKVVMLIVEDENTCVDTAFMSLGIAQNPEVNFNSTIPQCINSIFNLSGEIVSNGGSPIDSVYWVINNTTFISAQNISYSHPIKDTIPVVFYAKNEEGCIDGLQKFIIIDSLADAHILGNDTVICIGDSLLIFAEGSSNFFWEIDSSSQSSLSAYPTVNTVYKLIGVSANGACPNSEDEILVEVLQEPEYLVSVSSQKPGLGTPVFIDFSYSPQYSSSDSIKWLSSDTKNELEYEFGEENNFIAVESVSFPLEIKYNKENTSCVFKTSIEVEVNENCDNSNIFIPNAFTPNNDGSNEFFKIKGYSLSNLKSFVIFDRFGKEMYFEENITFNNGVAKTGWNGNDKNNVKCNTGVFVYYYKALCVNGLETQGSGNITLFR